MSNIGAPKSFLKIGLQGKFEGVDYTIVGRARYKGTITEWDEEDNKYWKGSWEYDEWYLTGSAGKNLVITEDTEGFEVEKELESNFRDFPSSTTGQISFFPKHAPQMIYETGEMELIGHEGELTWIPEPNLHYKYVEYKMDGKTYSMEREVDKNTGTVYETVFHESRKIPPVFLAEAFGVENTFKQNTSSSSGMGLTGYSTKNIIAFIVIILFSLAVTLIPNLQYERTCAAEELDENGECPHSIRHLRLNRNRSYTSGGISSGK